MIFKPMKFFDKKYFPARNISDQNYFLTNNFFQPTNFSNQQISANQNILLIKNKFLPQFFYIIICMTKHFLWPNLFIYDQHFSRSKTQKLIYSENWKYQAEH